MSSQYDVPARRRGSSGGPERVDTVVIGGGQAGLAVGYHLAKRGQQFVILDENARVGDQWRRRYDSLRLYSPAKYDALPGTRFPAAPYEFPTAIQLADYLESYAVTHQLPVRAGVSVDAVRPTEAGFEVGTGGSTLLAQQVVVATGGQHLPYTPGLAGDLDPGIRQLHSDAYRNPAQLLPGGVLVVGASHSGADIAHEVASGHDTWMCGPGRGEIPFDIEGRPARVILRVLWFAANHVLTARTPVGRRMRPEVRNHGGPLLRVKSADLAAAGVTWTQARMTGVRDGLPMLDDGQVLDVSNVIWCTGYRRDLSWIDAPVLGDDGWPVQERGVSGSVPGLYFGGLIFQHAFASMLVGGAGRDAEYVARHIAARTGTRAAA